MGKSTDKAGSVQAHIEQIVALLGSGNSPGQSPSNTQRSGRNKKKQSDSQLAFQAWFNNVDIQQVESVFSDCIKDGPEEEEEEEDPDPFPVPEKDQEWSDTVYNKLAASPEITKIFGTVISTSKKHDVEAKEIQDHLDMPAYPDTSPGGIMHFIKTEPGLYPEHIKSKDQKERQKAYQKLAADLMSKVQFCFRQQGSPKNATLQVLSGPEHQRQGFHQRYTCTGILHCETPNPKIFPDPSKDQSQYSPEFDRVDMSKLGLLHQEELENEKRKTSEERLRDRTLALFHAIVQLYQKEESFSCILEGCGNTCKNGVLRTFKRNGALFVGCPLSCDSEPHHYALPLKNSVSRINPFFLRALCIDGVPDQSKPDLCSFIGRTTSKLPNCGHDHAQGSRKTIHCECGVILNLYIPFDLETFPFAILRLIGSHSHHPPPPTKLPGDIRRDLIKSLDAYEILGLTAVRFQTTPEYYRLCRKFNVDSLRGIHWALNIECTINALIRKERLLQYPAGTALAGVQREFELDQKRSESERWIREISYLGIKKDISRYFVICITQKQASAFRDCAHIQMDLSFKMVHGQTNLYSVVGLNEITHEIDTFAYVFLNWETTEAYFKLFSRMFYWLGRISGTPVRFKHIHGPNPDHIGRPVSTATLDMCKKQAHGLGQYLHGLDPSKSWQEHLPHVVIFCKVHLVRGFHSKYPKCDLGSFMDQIFGSPSKERLNELMKAAIHLYPETANWWSNKLPDWLQGGLCQACSKIDPVDWANALKHTGINESEHFMVNNFTGRSIPFLMAIKLLFKFVINREERLALYEDLGIHHKQKSLSTEAHFIRKIRDWNENYKKQAGRRQENPRLSWNPSNAFDTPNQSRTGQGARIRGIDDLLQQGGQPVDTIYSSTEAETELRALSDQWMAPNNSYPGVTQQQTISSHMQQNSGPSQPEPRLPDYPRHMGQIQQDHSEIDPPLHSDNLRSSPPPFAGLLPASQASSMEGPVSSQSQITPRSSPRKRGLSQVSTTSEGITEAQLAEKERRISELRLRVEQRRAQTRREERARQLEEEERLLLEELDQDHT